ncbi:hypothetical protein Bbelb_267280 [Branchiostoma belcheri]|nr:hypothetical protein Bbelb_267280 [Branchiostoma belcheri]
MFEQPAICHACTNRAAPLPSNGQGSGDAEWRVSREGVGHTQHGTGVGKVREQAPRPRTDRTDNVQQNALAKTFRLKATLRTVVPTRKSISQQVTSLLRTRYHLKAEQDPSGDLCGGNQKENIR